MLLIPKAESAVLLQEIKLMLTKLCGMQYLWLKIQVHVCSNVKKSEDLVMLRAQVCIHLSLCNLRSKRQLSMDGTWCGCGMCMLGVCLYASAGLKRSSSGCTLSRVDIGNVWSCINLFCYRLQKMVLRVRSISSGCTKSRVDVGNVWSCIISFVIGFKKWF